VHYFAELQQQACPACLEILTESHTPHSIIHGEATAFRLRRPNNVTR